MIIHFSILVLIIAVSSFYEKKLCCEKTANQNYIMPMIPWAIVFGYLALLAAMRSEMNDTSVYINSFKRLDSGISSALRVIKFDGKDKAFDALGCIFKQYISTDYHMWFLLFGVIESLCFVDFFRKNGYDIWIICFYFWASTLYYNYFSMMRQWFAVALIMWAFRFIKSNEIWKYILVCIITAQFHASAYLCILFYFVAKGEPWKSKQLSVLFFSAVGLFFFSPILNALQSNLEGTTYDYIIDTMQSGSGSSPIRIFIAAVPVVLAFINRDKISSENSITLNFSVNYSVLFFLLTTIASFTSGLYVIRLTTFIQPFNAILFSYILNHCFDDRNKRIVNLGFFVLYFVYFYYQNSHMHSWGYSSDILGNFY